MLLKILDWVFEEMKNKFLILLLFMLTSFAVTAEPCVPTKHVPVPNITDKSYHQARKLLLANQWQPLVTIPFNEAEDTLMFSGNGWGFWSKGYLEVESCAGTGMAPCVFNFTDIYGNILKVHTAGEEIAEQKNYAGVTGYGFYCKD